MTEQTTDDSNTQELSQPFEHITVLLDEVVRALAPRSKGRYLDATLGGGGHAEAVLRASAPDGTLLGVDRDPLARAHAAKRLEPFGDRVRICEGTFRELGALLVREGVAQVDGLVADLGVSSPQLDLAERGMSFRTEGPLDMRMDPTQGPTALELIQGTHEKALADLIYQLGEERASRPIARLLKEAAREGRLETTKDVARVVYRVLGPPRPGRGIDPATRTFQALRIAVNDELGQLEALLRALPDLLADGGVAAVISFHSLEDRLVKHSFRGDDRLEVLTKKPLEASDSELEKNPRARSARLRVARRVPRGG